MNLRQATTRRESAKMRQHAGLLRSHPSLVCLFTRICFVLPNFKVGSLMRPTNIDFMAAVVCLREVPAR